jgi:hypothetical protein
MEGSLTDRITEEFVALTLPKQEWTHHAHLRVGLWHLLRYPPKETLDRLRAGIKQYNLATGGTNTEASGYHETITRFYVWQIDWYLCQADRTLPIDVLAEELIRRFGDKKLPLKYYSEQRLMSVAARSGWVEPDLMALTLAGQ